MKTTEINIVSLIRDYLHDQPWQYRIKQVNKDLPSNWSKWIINPSGNYVETETSEPVLISEIDWIEINPIENRRIGKLVADKKIDHSYEIFGLLDDMIVDYLIYNDNIRINPVHRDIQ
jgi:hypothetical protein